MLRKMPFFIVLLFLFCASSLVFAMRCPSSKEVASDYQHLKVHEYVKVPHRGGWEAAINHMATNDTFAFDYVQIDPDAPLYHGVKCFYSTRGGDEISVFYRTQGKFDLKGKHWRKPISGGPMCGDYQKTIKDTKVCQFTKLKK